MTRSLCTLASATSISLLLAIAAACGGSSGSSPTSPTAPSTPQTTTLTYSGTYQTAAGAFGSITLNAVISAATLAADSGGVSTPKAVATATGTLKPGGSADSIPLTGTYDTTSKKFTVTGSGFAVSATVTTAGSSDTVNGSVSSGGTQGTMVALPTSTGPIVTYCGNFSGDERGTLVITRQNNSLVALISEQGSVAEYSVTGTLNGTAVLMSWDYKAPDVGKTTVTGTLNGTVMSGTWVANFVEPGIGAVVQRGDWIVRAGSCPL